MEKMTFNNARRAVKRHAYKDWLGIILWHIRYNRRFENYSVFQHVKFTMKSFIKHWDYKPQDRVPLINWTRFAKKTSNKAGGRNWFVDGKWGSEAARQHQEWDLTLSSIACGRVCGKDVDGCCPFPFELDQSYWLKEKRLPLFSSYARRQWTPKFGETEDVFDAKFIPSHYTGVRKYTINGDIEGWIVNRH